MFPRCRAKFARSFSKALNEPSGRRTIRREQATACRRDHVATTTANEYSGSAYAAQCGTGTAPIHRAAPALAERGKCSACGPSITLGTEPRSSGAPHRARGNRCLLKILGARAPGVPFVLSGAPAPRATAIEVKLAGSRTTQMTKPTVFVASSSEALDVVNAVQQLLQRALGESAAVTPWSKAFQLTKTPIESLERLLDRSGFAVLVFTPDDRTKSRKAERWSPRDNVVFELGLFFARLGRERCFLIQRSDLDLKLPTDLLGIEPAKFSMSPGQNLENALRPACVRIGKAISDAMAARFVDRITGTWWEQISLKKKKPALSFLTIELDDVHGSVRLDGKAYGPNGVQVASWRSKFTRLEGESIVYVRECQRSDAETTAWLPGLGEVTFDDSSDVIVQSGYGKFWESDESHPENTVIKLVKLRRTDESDALTMRKGSEGEKKDLVLKTLSSW